MKIRDRLMVTMATMGISRMTQRYERLEGIMKNPPTAMEVRI
jgi:hypothetical protein